MGNIKIIYYTKVNGVAPVKNFLLNLDVKMRAKLTRAINLLSIAGNELRAPHSKHIQDGIFELRAQIGTNISRVLYFFVVGNEVILTNGFVKKTQATPLKEIEKAKRYREDYLKREGY